MNILNKGLLLKCITVKTENLLHKIPKAFAASCIQCLHNQTYSDIKYKDFSSYNKTPSRRYQFKRWPTQKTLLQTSLLQHGEIPKTLISSSNPLFIQQKDRILKTVHVSTKHYRDLSITPKAILDASPKGFQPYMRLIRFDKPIGTWLLYWPCTWSIGLAASPGHFPDLWLLTLFGAGAFFMRGAGCIINDMWDSDIDKKVERTKLRPLASGELSFFQGLCCLGGMLSISLLILLQLNWYSVFVGAASMLLVILYPLAKRVTFWPQAMLGLTFNYGALLGWSAATGAIDWTVVMPLYIGCMAWTLTYDTIYAHQDKYDDMLIGVKSTALKFGDKTKIWLSGFGTIMIGGLTMTGIACDQTWPYFTGVAFTAAHIAHQLYTVDLNNPDDCAAKFRSNTGLGFIMFLSIVIGTLLKSQNTQTEEKQS